MARKTVEIEYVKGYVNSILSDKSANSKNVRFSMAIMLELILMNAGAYKGFKYLDCPAGHEFDDSRREYF